MLKNSFTRLSLYRGAMMLAPIGALLATSPVAIAQPTDQHQPMIPAPPAKPITLEELAAAVGAPTVVTFSGTNVPVKEVKAAMLEAAGIDPSENSGPFGGREYGEDAALKNVTVNWVEIPFWKAAQQMEDLTGAKWSGVGPGGFSLRSPGTMLEAGRNVPMPQLPGFTPGDFMASGDLNGNIAFDNPYVKVIAKSLSSTRNATTEFSAADNGAKPEWKSTLTLVIYRDPKVKVEGNKVTNVKVQVAGKPLMDVPKVNAEFDMMTMILSSVDRRGLLSLSKFDLLPGLEPGTILERVTGTVQLNVALNADNWKVADVTAKPADSFNSNGMTLKYQNARLEGGKFKLRVSIAAPTDPTNPMAAFRTLSGLSLRDAKGIKLEQDAGVPNMNFGANNEAISMDLTFKGGKGAAVEGPVSLEWKVTGETRPLDVPFELRDIVVP